MLQNDLVTKMESLYNEVDEYKARGSNPLLLAKLLIQAELSQDELQALNNYQITDEDMIAAYQVYAAAQVELQNDYLSAGNEEGLAQLVEYLETLNLLDTPSKAVAEEVNVSAMIEELEAKLAELRKIQPTDSMATSAPDTTSTTQSQIRLG